MVDANTNQLSDQKALILNIQRMSTEDGPGIRTTVFFKGCTLSCAWCHNPESISFLPDTQWTRSRCIGCRHCVNVCRSGAISMLDEGITIDRDKCIRCLMCAGVCPAAALEVKGGEWESEKLAHEVLKDRVYFEKSQGGVTASGGEAMAQADFVSRFFSYLKKKGIHTALDTCGMCTGEAFEKVLPYTDLVLYDLKLMDSALHKKFTGKTNETILKNILLAADAMRAEGNPKELWIRTPVIPGATASDENIRAIGSFIAANLNDVVSRWDLCAFNNLCRDKYRALGREWLFSETELMEKDEMNRYASLAAGTGVKPEIVHWSGATRLDD